MDGIYCLCSTVQVTAAILTLVINALLVGFIAQSLVESKIDEVFFLLLV